VLTFGDTPVKQELVDVAGKPLAATFTSGSIAIAAAEFEGDVSPRPAGDEQDTIADWVLIGRYAAQLDSPTNSSEFQRADCAPRGTLGDGSITVTDWVQAGRYAAALDPMNLAGGPTIQGTSQRGPVASKVFGKKDGGPSRMLRIRDALLLRNQTAAVLVELEALGDENALGFSISFDPTVLKLSAAALGNGASGATVNINSNQVDSGHLAVVLALPAGSSFAAGTKEIMKLSFGAAGLATSTSFVMFADQPVRREVSDANTAVLDAEYVNGAVTVNPLPSLTIEQAKESITLAWPAWATNFSLQQIDNEPNIIIPLEECGNDPDAHDESKPPYDSARKHK
jgi:hypothetical protein